MYSNSYPNIVLHISKMFLESQKVDFLFYRILIIFTTFFVLQYFFTDEWPRKYVDSLQICLSWKILPEFIFVVLLYSILSHFEAILDR